jgi:ubiquinone/menaquinone biosynthesis C-methylase UbiE
LLPEALKHNAPYRALAGWRTRRSLQRTLRALNLEGKFDPDLKRRFLRGERFGADEIEEKYDLVWQEFQDDCVTGEDLETILSHIDEESRTCLEVGCGGGRVAIAMAQTGRQVTGVDASGEALGHARARATELGVEVEWRKAPIEELPYPDASFDVVTCCHTLEHVQDLPGAVAELIRVTRRQLIVIVPREDAINEYSTDYHFQAFPTSDALAKAIPLTDHECFVARVSNQQWQGEYIFFAGRIERAP